MKERKYEKIANRLYAIATIAFFAGIFIGGIGIKFSETFGMIFAYIAVGAFVYMLSVGLIVEIICTTIDDKMERRNSKSRELR